jgi:phosphatidylserine/phosphatidylglycerophosphate/cardiolipin synthase-like enzyme
MPDINTLRAQYFVAPSDQNLPSEPMPSEFAQCKITPLIDASSFNDELEAALALVGTGATPAANADHFILIANWWLGLSGGEYQGPDAALSGSGPRVRGMSPYFLDGPPPVGGTKSLLEILKAKAQAGVDVRVLGWSSIGVSGPSIYHTVADWIQKPIPLRDVNAFTMKSIKDLRAEPTIGNKAVLNIISHTAGAIHSKLVVIGNSTDCIGFTGGIDLVADRWAHPGHMSAELWHDAVAKVEGPAVQALYDWFKDMWHENISRPVHRFRFDGAEMPSFLPRAPVLPARALPPNNQPEDHRVQSLRTVPTFNYRWYNCLPENPPCSFAPQGVFQFRMAVRKALRAATTYVYMEDQAFWGRETLSFVNDAIKGPPARPDLRVILVTNGRADPNDPSFPVGYLVNSINNGLLNGLTPTQIDQVRMYRRVGGRIRVVEWIGIPPLMVPIDVTVTSVTNTGATSRLTLGDVAPVDLPADYYASYQYELEIGSDRFLIVGNPPIAASDPIIWIANNVGATAPVTGTHPLFARTAPVTVHAKTTLVDDEWAFIGSTNIMRRSLYTDLEHSVSFLDPAETLVREYRKRLWDEHFGHGNPADFHDIQEALHGWESTWGIAGAAPPRPTTLLPIPLPIAPATSLTEKEQSEYDNYIDSDSRDPWGGLSP